MAVHAIKAVAFDVGETLVRDDRYWASWADWLGMPRHALSALVGAVVAQGRDSADAIRIAKPGADVAAEYRAREAAGCGEHLEESDLYPDVRPVLAHLRRHGLRVVIAGNQSARAAELLRALDLPADAIATSGEWGTAKPERGFFERVVGLARTGPEHLVYVGDHPANDVGPAKAAGLRVAHIRRGPWGHLWAGSPVAAAADWHIGALTELPALLGA
ncbi:HAD family hydrolase [Streptomyces sp. NPDC051776]|uniref:HAD family hydrolase n=1 Tax=Streptomyces sp. NPDC051776 TaxID=3155414 RepID=UPI00343D5C33